MTNRLTAILMEKQREVADLRQRLASNNNHAITQVLRGELVPKRPQSFKAVLNAPALSVIAEIKRKSPSKGELAAIQDPISLAECYISGGASALSILTDKKFFAGDITDLIQVSKAIADRSIPIIRKDFIIDKIQIAEAAVAGASAVLCIIAVLGKKTKILLEFARSINLDVLVEIHDQNELAIALDCGAEIIGVNNRNLKTFTVDTQHALHMVSAIPDNIIKVAESGITHPALAREYYQAGYNAVLIGESLVKSDDPEKFIRECSYD
ncbi:indole-3-glycerol phosphate synthase TrpC [Rickettsiella endosymbiont of Miltochrista miniata]|uniref:indole-3-glycerol phosphate synthase TrpC n=1 Tax=Rickettsiella endosymbiont of Miltochrista miniata TaxID=3066239 RepID=UPI00313BA5DE